MNKPEVKCTRIGNVYLSDSDECPKCGSTNLTLTQQLPDYHVECRCQDCGHRFIKGKDIQYGD